MSFSLSEGLRWIYPVYRHLRPSKRLLLQQLTNSGFSQLSPTSTSQTASPGGTPVLQLTKPGSSDQLLRATTSAKTLRPVSLGKSHLPRASVNLPVSGTPTRTLHKTQPFLGTATGPTPQGTTPRVLHQSLQPAIQIQVPQLVLPQPAEPSFTSTAVHM